MLFQLARGDMGLFPAWRSTPHGTTLGDGPTAEIWFACALVALAAPRVWSLLLVAAAGAFDLFWRLPVVAPSIFFNGLVTLQILVTALALAVHKRSPRIGAAEFMARLRPGLLTLLAVLFFFAVFHKFTSTSIDWSAAFFRLMGYYYVYGPLDYLYLLPNWLLWLLTVGGEAAIFFAFAVPRWRPFASLVLIAFAAFVGILVYGFGSILLACAIGLAATGPLLEPLRRLPVTRRLSAIAPARAWRIVFVVAAASVFLFDHATGFTLADRRWLFDPDHAPTTVDVLTPMQIAWFALSGSVLASASIATGRHLVHLGAPGLRLARHAAAWAVPALLIVSELGLYVGAKTAPNIAMFSGLRVASAEPNHFVLRSHLLTSRFHRDLLLVKPPWQDDRIGIPTLSLQALLRRARRLGIHDAVVDAYHDGTVTRLLNGVEVPFAFADLDAVVGENPWERILPHALFLEEPVSEPDLRAAMPELFVAQ